MTETPHNPSRPGRPGEPGQPATDDQKDAVSLLITAVNTLPAAERDAVYSWLLRREPVTVPVPGWSRASSPALAAELMRPGSPALAQSLRTTLTAGQQMVPVRFSTEQHAQLREWCAEHGFSMATVIRGLVARFLEGQLPRPADQP
jgi:hypothetical protein